MVRLSGNWQRLSYPKGLSAFCCNNPISKDDAAFYAWYFDNQIDFPEKYLKNLNFEGKLYVLDGVGAEFINYLCALLKERGFCVDACCYVHIPRYASALSGSLSFSVLPPFK